MSKNYKIYHKINFPVLIIGWGSIGRCMLPMIERHFIIDPKNITVIESDNNRDAFHNSHPEINYSVATITKETCHKVLETYAKNVGMVINLAADIDCVTIIKWCQDNDKLYIDASIEKWPEDVDDDCPLNEITTYHSAQLLKEIEWKSNGPTAVTSHGANPGLITHYTKKGLLDLCDALELKYKKPKTRRQWALLMQRSGTKIIQCSERDTHRSLIKKKHDEFVNTWSIPAFCAELVAPAELGWGTHEKWMPEDMRTHEYGNKNAVYLERAGMDTLVKSWVPSGSMVGYLIQHGEATSLSDYFTVWKGKKAIYRPTVYYAYLPCDDAIESISEFNSSGRKLQSKQRLLMDETVTGSADMGAFLLGHNLNGWWTGDGLTTEKARILVPGQNSTNVAVCAGLLGALVWALENPKEGFCEPEDLPYEYVLNIACDYLGGLISHQVDWTPGDIQTGSSVNEYDESDPWQFKNFLLKD